MLSRDTTPDAEAVQIALMRAASASQKLCAAGEMTAAATLLARAGLRQRHPGATADQIASLLARLVLGDDLAGRAFAARAGGDAS